MDKDAVIWGLRKKWGQHSWVLCLQIGNVNIYSFKRMSTKLNNLRNKVF
jgi:hypothetical protein